MSRRNRGHKTVILAVAVAWALVVSANAQDAPGTAQGARAAELLRQETKLREAIKANPNGLGAIVHLQLGRIYIEEGKWGPAVVEARAARGSDEADALLARALYGNNEIPTLVREIKPGKREARAESQVRLNLGLAAFVGLDLDSAESLLGDAVRLDPQSWEAHTVLARVLIVKRKLPAARDQIKAATALAPDKLMLTRITGQLYRAEGNTDGAIAEFDKALNVDPASMTTLASRADALISLDKLDDARRDVTAAIKVRSIPQLVFLGALILARQDKLSAADQQLLRISGAFSRNIIAYFLAGVLKFRLGEAETAEFNLTRFQARQPNVTAAACLRAQLALQRKHADVAIDILKPLVQANPADHPAVIWLARAYLAADQQDQVIQLYQDVAAAPRDNMVALADPASLLTRYGDATDDILEIEKVIQSTAKDTVVPMAALRAGDIEKASVMAEALATSNPNNPAIQNLLGSVRLAQKRLPEAEAIFRRILATYSDFVDASFGLVEALVAQQQLDEAKTMLADLAKRS